MKYPAKRRARDDVGPSGDSASGLPARPASLDDCVRVFERDFDYVYRTLQRFGVQMSDAEDLAQEVFLVVWRRRGDWDPSSSLRPWLAAIAFRMAIAHRRRSLREVPAGLVDTEDGAPELDDRLSSAAVRRLVLEVLGRLPPKQRAVLVMYEIDQVPMKEVASALGLPVFTAYTRLRVARQRFAKELRRYQLRARPGHGQTLVVPALCWDVERAIPEAPLLSRRRVFARLDRPAVAGGPAAPLRAGRVALRATAVAGLLAGLGLAVVTARPAPPGAPPPVMTTAPAPRAADPARKLGHRLRARPTSVLATALPLDRARPESLARGLVSYWRFDDLRGSTTARDFSGNGNDCLIRRIDSTGWIDGVMGGALRLAGGGWLECPSAASLQRVTTEISISAWIRRFQHQKHLRTIVARQYGSGEEDDFYLGLTFGRLIFASRVWGRLEAHIPQTLGQWVHVAAVRGGDGTLRLYVDGAEVKSLLPDPPYRGGTLAGTPYANPVLVGAAFNTPDPTWANQKLNGAIDELAIYDRALSPADIAALAAATQPRL